MGGFQSSKLTSCADHFVQDEEDGTGDADFPLVGVFVALADLDLVGLRVIVLERIAGLVARRLVFGFNHRLLLLFT